MPKKIEFAVPVSTCTPNACFFFVFGYALDQFNLMHSTPLLSSNFPLAGSVVFVELVLPHECPEVALSCDADIDANAVLAGHSRSSCSDFAKHQASCAELRTPVPFFRLHPGTSQGGESRLEEQCRGILQSQAQLPTPHQ